MKKDANTNAVARICAGAIAILMTSAAYAQTIPQPHQDTVESVYKQIVKDEKGSPRVGEYAAATSDAGYYDFVNEYIRELATLNTGLQEDKQDLKSLAPNDGAGLMELMVHSSTREILSMGYNIAQLQSIHIAETYQFAPNDLIAFYKQRRALYVRLRETAQMMLAGPQPGVNYGSLAAQVPEIRAEIEYVNQSIFKATNSVFITLISVAPNDRNRADTLRITESERKNLIRKIRDDFGADIENPEGNPFISSAWLLLNELEKKWRTSDSGSKP